MNLLFEHGCIITENPQEEVIRDGWLLVSDGKILGLGEGDYPGPILPDRRVQAAGHAILPGIVDYHTHVCGSLFKGCCGISVPVEVFTFQGDKNISPDNLPGVGGYPVTPDSGI